MQIYRFDKSKLKKINQKPFKLEKHLQNLLASNLKEIMELTVVKNEFTIKNNRIDTLAYNEYNKSFTIIEYKRNKSTSIIDQGFAYLKLVLENQAEVILEYNEQLKKNLKRRDIDWSQTRVVFVSPSFTYIQIQASDFKDSPIELWEAKQYDDNIIVIIAIKKSQGAPSIKTIMKGKAEYNEIANQINVPTEEDHLINISEEIVELYEKFRTAILNLDDGIEIIPQKRHIAFKKDGNIVDIGIFKKSLNLWVNAKKGTIHDTKGLTRDVEKISHHGSNGHYEIKVTNDEQLEYIMSLIKQVLLLKNHLK